MKVLFVCLGNICRSPIAEAVLAQLVATRPDAAAWRIDSAATGHWHVGRPPDGRALAELARHGVPTSHLARQVTGADFTRFDRILAMDRANLADLGRLRPAGPGASLGLLGEFDPQGVDEVPDPYHGGAEEFATVHAQVRRCCTAFLASLTA